MTRERGIPEDDQRALFVFGTAPTGNVNEGVRPMVYGASAQMPLRPVRGLALTAMVSLGLHVFLLLGGAAISLWAVILLPASGGVPSERVIGLTDRLTLLLEVQFVIGYLLAAAAVIAWMWRVHTNTSVIGGEQRWGRPWTIFGWAIPVINLFVPRRILVDAWHTSAPDRTPVLVNTWWAAWLLFTFADRVASARGEAETVSELRIQMWQDLALLSLGAVAAVLAIMTVWRITRLQEADSERIVRAITHPSGPPQVTMPESDVRA